MTWQDIQNNIKKRERHWLVFILIILFFGIGDELFARIYHSVFFILYFDSVSLTILSIEATVSTLVITILSLMANKMDAAYKGVSINDFLLNIKPQLFKQKRIITAEIGLIVGNIIVHMAGWYNVVVAIFIISMLLVLISVSEIYEAFLGSEKLNEEIDAYLKDNATQSGSGDDTKEEPKEKPQGTSTQKLKNLTDQWKNEIASQSEPLYEDYLETFNNLFPNAFAERREELLNQCVELSRALFTAHSEDASLRGIEFVSNCYTQEWLYIRDHEELTGSEFNLFDLVFENFISGISEINIKKLDKSFHWWYFTETIIQNALFLKNKTKSQEKSHDIEAAKDFCSFLGRFISSDQSVQVTIDKSKWDDPLRFLYAKFSYPDELKPFANKAVAECFFNFMLPQAANGYYDLIEDGWYKGLSLESSYKTSDDFVYTALKLHCYIFYLAYYETKACTSQETLDAARVFIEKGSIGRIFADFVEIIAESDENVMPEITFSRYPHNIFNEKLEERLRTDLRRYEFMPGDFIAKQILMDEVAQDFVTFLSCYIGNALHTYEVLNSIIPEVRSSIFYMRYIQSDRSEDLKRFFRLMGVSLKTFEINTENGVTTSKEKNTLTIRSSAAYEELVNVIEKRYKDWTLHSAANGKKFSEEQFDEQSKKAEEALAKFLKESFSGLIIDDIKTTTTGNIFRKNGYHRYTILRFAVFADTDVEKLISESYDQIFIRFTNTLANGLWNGERVDKINKDKMSDEEWLSYLETRKDKIVIGSVYALRTDDYRNKSKVKDWIDGTEHYTNGAYGDALILDQGTLKLDFRNAQIEIRPERIDETGVKPDPQSGVYRYSPSVNMPVDFTENELGQYLNDKMRIVDVSIEIGIEVVGDGKIGDLIEAE
jgi:hypothetical protein